jgi:hypothetical protein
LLTGGYGQGKRLYPCLVSTKRPLVLLPCTQFVLSLATGHIFSQLETYIKLLLSVMLFVTFGNVWTMGSIKSACLTTTVNVKACGLMTVSLSPMAKMVGLVPLLLIRSIALVK